MASDEMAQSKTAQDKQENDKMEKGETEPDTEAHVIASDPMSKEQSQIPPPATPSPTTDDNPSSLAVPDASSTKGPQEDLVRVDDGLQQNVNAAKPNSPEPEYFDLDIDGVTAPIESLDDYGPGGFHPVHLGDILGPLPEPSRFRVLHKLGCGGFGTVWLCRDNKDGKPKALKILAADASEKAAKECPDLRALQILTQSAAHEAGLSESSPRTPQTPLTAEDLLQKHHIALPTEHFWLPYQPNGTHLCFVMPFLGPSLGSFCSWYGHVADLVNHVCFQLVEAMRFMHDHGLCHGDFRPANILLCLKEEVDRMGDDELVEALGGVQIARLSRVSPDDNSSQGNQQKEKAWSKQLPRYFVGQANMVQLIERGLCSPKAAVIDFGVSYPVDKPPANGTGIPEEYAPPEEVITRRNENGKVEVVVKLGPKSDTWSLAVTLFELALGGFPFKTTPDGLLRMVGDMESIMGPVPEPFRTAFRVWYKENAPPTSNKLQAVDMVTDPATGEKILSPLTVSLKKWKAGRNASKRICGYEDRISHLLWVGLHQTLPEATAADIEAQWAKDKTSLPSYSSGDTDMDEYIQLAMKGQAPKRKVGNAEAFRDLLLGIFKWMPEDRMDMAAILAHPWFVDRHAPSDNIKPQGLVSKLSQGMYFPLQHGPLYMELTY